MEGSSGSRDAPGGDAGVPPPGPGDSGSAPGSGERPKVAISVMRAALAAANVPTVGLLERAEFEALYWKLQEGGGGAGPGPGREERAAVAPAAVAASGPASAAAAGPASAFAGPRGTPDARSAKVEAEWEAATRRAEVER